MNPLSPPDQPEGQSLFLTPRELSEEVGGDGSQESRGHQTGEPFRLESLSVGGEEVVESVVAGQAQSVLQSGEVAGSEKDLHAAVQGQEVLVSGGGLCSQSAGRDEGVRSIRFFIPEMTRCYSM